MSLLTTAGLTVLGGIIVFVIGQIAVKSFIDPIGNVRGLIGEIAADLTLLYG